MRILYLHQYFRYPEEGGIIRSFHIAEKFAIRGHQVTIVRGDHVKNVAIPPYPFEVKNCHVKYDGKFPIYRRIISFIFYYIKARRICLKLHKEKPFDMIFATSTPLSVGFLAFTLSKKIKVPYIFEVRDLWPEIVFELLPVSNRFIKKKILNKTARIYKHAATIIALSPGMAAGIQMLVSKKVHIIPNFSSKSLNPDHIKSGKIFSIGYFGSFGDANHITFMENFIRKCAYSGIVFRMAGWGKYADKFKKLSSSYENVHYLGMLSHKQTIEEMNKVDATLISFLPNELLSTVSPNKFFDGLANGKIIILNVDGWLKELVLDNNAGIYLPPDKPDDWDTILNSLKQNKSLQIMMKTNALSLSKQFDKDRQTDALADIAESLFRSET